MENIIEKIKKEVLKLNEEYIKNSEDGYNFWNKWKKMQKSSKDS